MRKIRTIEMQRLTVEEYRQAEKKTTLDCSFGRCTLHV